MTLARNGEGCFRWGNFGGRSDDGIAYGWTREDRVQKSRHA